MGPSRLPEDGPTALPDGTSSGCGLGGCRWPRLPRALPNRPGTGNSLVCAGGGSRRCTPSLATAAGRRKPHEGAAAGAGAAPETSHKPPWHWGRPHPAPQHHLQQRNGWEQSTGLLPAAPRAPSNAQLAASVLAESVPPSKGDIPGGQPSPHGGLPQPTAPSAHCPAPPEAGGRGCCGPPGSHGAMVGTGSSPLPLFLPSPITLSIVDKET